MDFIIDKYLELITSLKNKGYVFQTFKEFLCFPSEKSIVLRHDVDLLPQNSLRFALIQYEMGIKGSYYFRAVAESWDEEIIIAISEMGHEIGYHYESLTTCGGNVNSALLDFKENLNKLRELTDVVTICMHGSPVSKYDSRDLWKEFNYKDFGIIGEPYFDVDFDQVFYLTDTGRRWDGLKFSVRDKVKSSYKLTYRSTNQLIEGVEKNELPHQVMFTFHPQRWHENSILWAKELVLQNSKNMVKKYFFVKSNS